MLIDLQYPFKDRWLKGYLVVNSENRRNVILYNSKQDRTTISYARYLKSVEEKRFLESTEVVDHIDNNKTNDVLSNLQILTVKENNKKESRRRGRQLAVLSCPVCFTVFQKEKRHTQAIPAYKGRVSCCSIDCKNKFLKYNKTKEQRVDISESSLLDVITVHT